jgi:ribulose-phosphate 3-epimerase
MALIAPSILSADFARLGDAAASVGRGGARLLHVDVMDGRFAPNLTLGPPVVKSLNAATDLFLDCHLMVEEPDGLIPEFIAAGADSISVHVEAVRHLHRTLQLIRQGGARAGVALNPASPLVLIEDVLEDADYVLLMSVNPGFSGQKFIPRVMDKVRRLADILARRDLPAVIQVDGGVGEGNAAELAAAGAGLLVAGSAVFAGGDAEEATRRLTALTAGAGRDPEWVP